MPTSRASFMNELNNKFKNTSPQTTITQTNVVSDPIWDMINSESVTTRNMKISDQINKLKEKHTIRLNMAKGKVSSGNKNTDKLENARSSLADYARSQYIKEAENDASMDLSILDKMQDQDIIDWMTKDDPEAQQTYIDFINKWWFVKDTYNKMMWIDEEAIKEAERKDSWWLKNFVGSATYEIPGQLWWLLDVTWVTDYFNSKDKERLDKYNQVSTDEYNKYKKWEISFDELKDKWVSGIYLDYENDVDNWTFRWSVEEYGKAMYNKWVGNTEKTMQEKMFDDFLINYYKEWSWAWAWKFASQMVEFLTMPWSNMWWLWNTLLWTAEILWLNTLSEWKLPSKWEALTTTWLTALLESVLRVPWWVKMLRSLIWKTTPEVKNALANTTRKERKTYWDIAKQWFTATKNKATEYLNKAATWIKNKIESAWKDLKEIRKNLKGNFKFQDYWDAINKEFKKFETEWWWGVWYAPEIVVDDAWNMIIKNEEALSNVVDDKWQKLVDYIKSEWDAFKNQWKTNHIKNVENFMKNLSDKIYEASTKWWIKSSDSSVKAILEWTNNAYEKIYEVMWEEGQKFKDARKLFSKLKDYEEFFEKYIWKIKWWEKWKSALADLEKTRRWEKSMWKWWDFLWEFLNLLKKDNVVEEDLASELTSLLYAFWIKNPKQLQEMIETIYPSIPWLREVWLNILRRWMKNSEAETMLKDAVPWKLDVWQTINNIVRPATQVWEERLMEY